MGRRLISCCMALLMLGCALAEDELDITYRFGSREEGSVLRAPVAAGGAERDVALVLFAL